MKNLDKVLLGGLLASTSIGMNFILGDAEQIGVDQYIITNNLNMRKGPSSNYISVGTLKKGTKVIPLEYSQDKLWGKIKNNNQYVWVCTTYLKKVEDDSTSTDKLLGNYLTKEKLNLRRGPSTSKPIVLTIPKGAKVKVVDMSTDNKWAHVSYKDETGWVRFEYLKKYDANGNPDEDNTAKYEDHITTTGVNVRSGPSVNYSKIGSLSKGVTVKPLEIEKQGYWMRFNYNGKDGWVCTTYLKKASEIDDSDNNNTSTKTLYTSENVNLRSGASTSSSRICTVPKNSKVSVLSYNSNKTWAKIVYNNKTGWISAKYLKSEVEQTYWDGRTITRLNLRQSPNTSAKILITIPNGSKVKVYEENGSWLRVNYNNTYGYCSAMYIK
ncbi:MAG: SH3 domain-containing protein [Terrisporobacter sp.]|uniref:SH3 domain-containing protein n=1 Tax=Terrisporobacter sp. TaxID=1965305 RepID=UPI002FC64E9A